MKVYLQKQQNDCGISVIKSVYEHLFKKELKDNTINQVIGYTPNGMSIYDLEIAAQNFNIQLESYKVSIEELKKLNYRDFFITLIKNQFGNHFVICKIKNTYVELYDSGMGQNKIPIDEFERIYDNVFIVFSKSIIKQEIDQNINLTQKIKFFEMPHQFFFGFLVITFDLLVLLISLFGSGLVKLAISFISDNIPKNLFFIAVYFIIIYSLENLMSYCFTLIKMKKIEHFSKRNMIFYLNYLNKKHCLFFGENKRKELYQYPAAIARVLETKYIQKPQFIADSIFLFCILLLLGSISIYYLFFGIGYSVISLALSYWMKKYNEKNFDNNNLLKNETDYYFHLLYDFLYNEKNFAKLNQLNQKCKSHYWTFSKQTNEYTNYFLNNNFVKNILKKVVFVLFVAISIFWISNGTNNIDISLMIFAITIINLADYSSNSVFQFISGYGDYKKSVELLNQFLTIDNKQYESNNKIEIKEINSIELKNLNFSYDNNNVIFSNFSMDFKNKTFIYGKNGIGKSTLLKILAFSLKPNNKSEILINGLDYKSYDLQKFEQKICYIPSDAIPFEIDFSGILNLNPNLTKEIATFLKATQISTKKPNEFSKGEAQLSNLLHLLKLKNHLILLDECFSNVSKENTKLFMDLFFKKISDNNFVICVSHSKDTKKYFKYERVIQ